MGKESYNKKRVVFCGCATGIGREAVLLLATLGAELFLVDVVESKLNQVRWLRHFLD